MFRKSQNSEQQHNEPSDDTDAYYNQAIRKMCNSQFKQCIKVPMSNDYVETPSENPCISAFKKCLAENLKRKI